MTTTPYEPTKVNDPRTPAVLGAAPVLTVEALHALRGKYGWLMHHQATGGLWWWPLLDGAQEGAVD